MSIRSLSSRTSVAVWNSIVAFLILGLGQGVWGALLLTNLKTTPAIPWAVAVMSLFLWLMWKYLGGSGWPHRTSENRRRYLRANRIPAQAWSWTVLAGVLSIVALTGYWIVLFQLVPMPGNFLPDLSRYPLLTVVLMLVMASFVSPVIEESAFRGYCQGTLEREFPGSVAILISSVLFALAHVTQGFLWPKLLVYFLAGVVFGTMAYLTNSILPGLAIHIIADLTFFALVWPYDTKRQLVWRSGADRWFWLHAFQAIIFTRLTVIAFSRLASARERVLAMKCV